MDYILSVCMAVLAAQATTSVEIKANADTVRRNDTAARIVLGREELLKFGDTSVLDSLKRLPGVSVDGGLPRLRGLGSGYTQILVNGERAPNGFTLDQLSPEQVERVEVMRSATADLGSQAIAGTINIVLRKSMPPASRELKPNFSAGSGRSAPGIMLALSDRADGLGYSASLDAWHVEQSLPSRGTLRQDADYALYKSAHNIGNGFSANGRVQKNFEGGASMAWQSFLTQARFGGESNEETDTLSGAPYPYPLLLLHSLALRRDARTELQWNGPAGEQGKIDSRLSLSASRIVREMSRLASAGPRTVLDRDYSTRNQEHGLAWTGKYSSISDGTHAFAVGWDAGLSAYSTHETQVDAVLPGEDAFSFDQWLDVDSRRLALYAQDEWTVTNDWSLYLGARWEGLRISAVGLRQSTSIASPVLQSLWKLPGHPGQQIRASISRTYRMPEPWQMAPRHFYTSFNSKVSPDFAGNPGLRPELAWGMDAAYEYFCSQGALISASATMREIDDVIQSRVVERDGRWISVPENAGKAQVRSLELEARQPLTSQLAARFSIARNWSHVEAVPGPGARLAQQPRWTGNLGADWRVSGTWSTGGSFAYATGGWTRSSASEAAYSGARRDLEAYALFKQDPNTSWRLSLRNLLRSDSISGRANGNASSMDWAAGYLSWRLQLEAKI